MSTHKLHAHSHGRTESITLNTKEKIYRNRKKKRRSKRREKKVNTTVYLDGTKKRDASEKQKMNHKETPEN